MGSGKHLHYIKARDLRAGHEVSGYGTVKSVHRRRADEEHPQLVIWFTQRPDESYTFDRDARVAVITDG